jgi:hypothetical protein
MNTNASTSTNGVAKTRGHRSDLDNQEEDGWISAATAAQRYGGSPRVYSRAAEEDRIPRKRSADNRMWLYSVDDCEQLKAEDSKADLMDTILGMLRASNQHAKDSFQIVHEPSRELFKLLSEENQSLRAEKKDLLAVIAEMRKAHDEAVRAREAALNEEHTRKLAERAADRREQRMDAMFEVFKTAGPEIVMQVLATIQERRDPRGHAAMALVEMMAAKHQSGDHTWTPEMAELLRKALGVEHEEPQAQAAE